MVCGDNSQTPLEYSRTDLIVFRLGLGRPSLNGRTGRRCGFAPPVRQPNGGRSKNTARMGTKAKPSGVGAPTALLFKESALHEKRGPPFSGPKEVCAPPTVGRCSGRKAVIVGDRCDDYHRY